MKFSASGSGSCPSRPLAVSPSPFFTRVVDFGAGPAVPGQPVLDLFCRIHYGVSPTDYSADWSFKVKPWLYRMGVGLRFRWTGE